MPRHLRAMLLAAAWLIVLSPSTVRADAFSLATATVNWSGVAMTGTLSFSGQYSIAIAEANRNGVQAPQVRNDVSTWDSVSSTNTLTNTTAFVSTTDTALSIQATALADGVGAVLSAPSGYISRGAYFTVDHAFSFDIEVPYTFAYQMNMGGPGDSVGAYGQISIWLGRFVGGDQPWETLATNMQPFNASNVNGIWSEDGILRLLTPIVLEPGESYALDVGLHRAAVASTTQIPVPEPATILLLGGGLCGLCARRRRRP
jgi:hypothetical protein